MKKDKIKTYREALDFIYAKLPMFQRIGPVAYKKDLSNTLQLCLVTGNPHEKLKTIHIAGTNGKGTTTHIIAGGLQAQGYKVGVYTSPHYRDFRERIKINGEYISKKFVVDFINTYYNEIEVIQPSFFEVTVAMAFLYFAESKVDYAVIETGLGGRLDSTNIITPILSVITNISYDHQNLLGDTLQEIAGEKAGIIKKGVPVIIGEKQPEIMDVFVRKSEKENAPLTYAEDHIRINNKSEDGYKNLDVYYQQDIWLKNLQTDLSGPFQEKNLVTGLYAIKVLAGMIDIHTDKLTEFFPHLKQSTVYLGRWQVLGNKPTIIADSAHNEGGLRIVLNEIKKQPFRKLHMVIGFVNDKSLNQVLSLFPDTATYYFAKANIPRGLDAQILADQAGFHGLKGRTYKSVKTALAAARKKATEEDFIFIGGSIFVVAEVL